VAEKALKQVYDHNYNLMGVLKQVNIPMPLVFRKNLELVINNQLRRFFQLPDPKAADLQRLVEEVRKWQVPLEAEMIGFVASAQLYELLQNFAENPRDLAALINLHQIMQQLGELDIKLDLWKMQNLFFQLAQQHWVFWQQETELVFQAVGGPTEHQFGRHCGIDFELVSACGVRSMAENAAADAHEGSALLQGQAVIARHAHAECLKMRRFGEMSCFYAIKKLSQIGKFSLQMPFLLGIGSDAHQSTNAGMGVISQATAFEQFGQFCLIKTIFVFFKSDVHLQQTVDLPLVF
jgi:hypothetical protein